LPLAANEDYSENTMLKRILGPKIQAAYRDWLSSTNLGDGRIRKDQDEDGETKNTLSFKGTDLKT
jgi:hypothetical protein